MPAVFTTFLQAGATWLKTQVYTGSPPLTHPVHLMVMTLGHKGTNYHSTGKNCPPQNTQDYHPDARWSTGWLFTVLLSALQPHSDDQQTLLWAAVMFQLPLFLNSTTWFGGRSTEEVLNSTAHAGEHLPKSSPHSVCAVLRPEGWKGQHTLGKKYYSFLWSLKEEGESLEVLSPSTWALFRKLVQTD